MQILRYWDGEGHGKPLQYSCLENPVDRGAWWTAVHWVAQSRTWLKQLSIMHALEREMATHSSILAWRIPGMEEPRGLPSVGSHRVGHDWSSLAAAADIESPEYSGAISAHSEIQLIYQICEIAFKHCDGMKEIPQTWASFLLPQQHVLTLKLSGRITILACENLTG